MNRSNIRIQCLFRYNYSERLCCLYSYSYIRFVYPIIYLFHIFFLNSKLLLFLHIPILVPWWITYLFTIYRLLPYIQSNTHFAIFCFLVRGFEAIGAGAFSTASFIYVIHMFPDNVSAVLVSFSLSYFIRVFKFRFPLLLLKLSL